VVSDYFINRNPKARVLGFFLINDEIVKKKPESISTFRLFRVG
jgi:hypothetical protein